LKALLNLADFSPINLVSWFNLAGGNKDHAAAHSLLTPQWDGEDNGQKVKLTG